MSNPGSVKTTDCGMYTILECDAFNADQISSAISFRIHEKNERLLGSIQVCPSPGGTTYYRYVATMVRPVTNHNHDQRSDW